MVEKPQYFAIIPAPIRYSKITANAKLLYGEITALCNKEGYCWASDTYFAKLYDVDERTIRRWIKELKEAKFIYTENLKEEGLQRLIYIVDTWTKMSKSADKNVQETADKNVLYNNTSINNTLREPEEFKTFFKQPKLAKPNSGYGKTTRLKNDDGVAKVIQLFNETRGGSYNNTIHLQVADELITKHGVDRVLEVTQYALNLKPQEYQVQIKMPVDLGDHWYTLVDMMEEKTRGSKYGIRY